LSLKPGLEADQAVDILNGRVALINKIHADIADWLQVGRISPVQRKELELEL